MAYKNLSMHYISVIYIVITIFIAACSANEKSQTSTLLERYSPQKFTHAGSLI
tara:strand:+ start:271 stop:429 length:159 start_codon:yes stop_codon:yes gene_type:complete